MDYALATGRVRDGSRGLAGVPVSNGELITRTAADGSFQLEFGPEVHRYLTVTTPDGYRPGPGCWRRLPLVGGEAGAGEELTADFALEADPSSTGTVSPSLMSPTRTWRRTTRQRGCSPATA